MPRRISLEEASEIYRNNPENIHQNITMLIDWYDLNPSNSNKRFFHIENYCEILLKLTPDPIINIEWHIAEIKGFRVFYQTPMLSPTKIKCMELWADKMLSKWCMFKAKNKNNDNYNCVMLNNEYFWNEYDDIIESIILEKSNNKSLFKIKKVIWHPITRWRLCYLQSIKNSKDTSTRYRLKDYFELTNRLYDKTILDRPEDFCENILLPFLESIQCNLQEYH